MVASDPGLGRLRMAASGAVGMGTALAVELLFASLTGAGPKGTIVSMLLGAVVAMMGSMALSGTGVWRKLRTAVFFPVAIGLGMTAGVAVAGNTDLMLAVFVVVMFLAVFVRRFGLPFFFYGFMCWMGYFFASFLHATMAMLPTLVAAAAVGAAWVWLLSITVLSTRPTRTLRRTVRAFDARARLVARGSAELVEAAHNGTPLRRARRVLRRRQDRLAEVALMVEAWSAEPRALPDGWSAPALRRRLIDAHQAADGMATAATALAGTNAWLCGRAVPVLDRLARRADTAAEQAARRLAEAAEDGERRDQDGWLAARHLSVAVQEFVVLARSAQTPPEAGEVDDFEPVVNLALGNLPGSPAVAREVPARHRSWNVLARLDMTTRQAIQVAIAGGLAILVGRELSTSRYYWAVIAAFIMFTGTATRSETFIKGLNRVLGTVVGLFASIWLAGLTAGHTPWVLAVIVASVFCGFYLIRISYGYMIFFITIMIGQLYTVLHQFSDGLLVLRLEETTIGAVVGFLVALLVAPLSTRDTVRSARDGVLSTLAELLEAAGHRLGGTPATGAAAGTAAATSDDATGTSDDATGTSDDAEAPHDSPADLDGLARALDDRVRQLALVAKPLTRPLVWGNSPPRVRHRLTLYAAIATNARALAVALRRHSGDAAGPARACRALAAAATELTASRPGRDQPAATAPLAEADTALFADRRGCPASLATDPVLRPLAHLHNLLGELAAPGKPTPEPAPVSEAAPIPDAPEPAPDPAPEPAPEPTPAPAATRSSEPDTAMLTGVVGTSGGAAAGGALVLLLDGAGHPVASTRAGADGRYRVDECPPGDYVAAVTADGHQPAARRVRLRAHRVTRADVTVAVAAPARPVRGTVYGPGSVGPLSEVSLTLLDGTGAVVASARTDAVGRYELPPLPFGDYTLIAEGYPPSTATTRLCAGRNRTLDLALATPSGPRATAAGAAAARHVHPARQRDMLHGGTGVDGRGGG